MDINELAEHLGIDQFAVAGVSGGGPNVVGFAYSIPELLTGCGIVSNTGSVDLKETWKKYLRAIRITFFLARFMSWIFKPIMKLQLRTMKKMEHYRRMTLKNSNLPAADWRLIEETDFFPKFFQCGVKGMKQRTKGLIYEYKLFTSTWGFDLQEISPELKTYVYTGDQDPNRPTIC